MTEIISFSISYSYKEHSCLCFTMQCKLVHENIFAHVEASEVRCVQKKFFCPITVSCIHVMKHVKRRRGVGMAIREDPRAFGGQPRPPAKRRKRLSRSSASVTCSSARRAHKLPPILCSTRCDLQDVPLIGIPLRQNLARASTPEVPDVQSKNKKVMQL